MGPEMVREEQFWGDPTKARSHSKTSILIKRNRPQKTRFHFPIFGPLRDIFYEFSRATHLAKRTAATKDPHSSKFVHDFKFVHDLVGPHILRRGASHTTTNINSSMKTSILPNTNSIRKFKPILLILSKLVIIFIKH